MTSPSLTLRPAQIADAERLIAIHFSAIQQISEAIYPRSVLNAWSPEPSAQRHQWMRDTIQSTERMVWVAQSAERIGAFAIVSTEDGFIHALYTDPNDSGLGMGKALLQQMEQLLFQAGIRTAQLKASLNAAPFYQAMGYESLHPTTQTLSDGSEMDCIVMRKNL